MLAGFLSLETEAVIAVITFMKQKPGEMECTGQHHTGARHMVRVSFFTMRSMLFHLHGFT
jgi:hypothetical protein